VGLYAYLLPKPTIRSAQHDSGNIFDLHKAPARFRGAANIIPKLHPRHYKTSTATSELAVKTTRQSPDSCGLSFGAQIAEIRLCLYSTAVSRCDWNQEV
jgi:hypothetical protein